MMNRLLLFLAAAMTVVSLAGAELPVSSPSDAALVNYFRQETAQLSELCLADIHSRADWEVKRGEFRRELQEMLGLWPLPERTDLQPVVTGKLEADGFTMKKISFQASPGLYCTANLFVPKNLKSPAPTILYECGHSRMVSNNISYGNKAAYLLDGAWFARNGYVCLVLDSLLLGEVQGIHTGTRDKGLWWWNSRGYTPAGVEAWFGIRALDYLCTRPEVDTNRFGITGHSGGGAYSWTVTALDDRIKAAAPLAGMADAQSHILDGVIDSHCDCNFFINIYRWDFPQLAALAAPRPLLIGGTDRDQIFHLDSTVRIHEKLRRVYELLGATNNLGLALAPGAHEEVPELRLAVLRWFNWFLKGVKKENETPIVVDAVKFFTPEQVRVFNQLPADALNINIAQTFVPFGRADLPVSQDAQQRVPTGFADQLRTELREKVFSGWPGEDLPLEPTLAFEIKQGDLLFRAWDFTSQHDVSLRLYLLENAAATNVEPVSLNVLDQAGAGRWLANVRALAGAHARFSESLAGEFSGTNLPAADFSALEKLKREVLEASSARAFFAPRGVGLTAWSGDEKVLTRIRRRFMLLGQTLDGMRVWDIRRAIQALHYVRADDKGKIELSADGPMAANALYAALFEPNVRRLELTHLPRSHTEGPDYLGVLKVCDLPQVLAAEALRAEVKPAAR